jgi:squalene-hopene/tetraprenyl-beta-curcumene cyclase
VTATAHQQVSQRAAAIAAVQRACRVLLAYQHPGGSWPDSATAEVSLVAESLLVREFLRLADDDLTRAAAGQIRSSQRADGSWAGAEPGAAADLSASVLAYLALRLAGDSPDAYHLAAAAGWIRDAGGLETVGMTARTWLAMFGLAAWADVAVPALDVLFRPGRRVVGQADSATWSRVVTVTLAIIGAVRPVHPLSVQLTELQVVPRLAAVAGPPRPAALSAARSVALRRCGGWLASWQQHGALADGWRPVWPCSLAALHVAGYSSDHPALAAGLARLGSGSETPESSPAGLAPIAQTTLAVAALRAAGLRGDDSALAAAASWLARRRVDGPVAGDGPGAGTEPAPCGWSFCPDGFPRPGDTALVLLAVRGIGSAGPGGRSVLRPAARWLAGTQDKDGSWGGSAALTGYSVRALATAGGDDAVAAHAVRRGVVWLLRAQLPLGAWPGRHSGGDLLATTIVLPALLHGGVRAGKPAVTGGVGWLLDQQNADGGWRVGEVAGLRRPGESDETGTAHALMALLAVGGGAVTDAVAAAVEWLIQGQRADGSWPPPPGTGGSLAAPRRPAGDPSTPVASILLPLAALGHYLAAGDGMGS